MPKKGQRRNTIYSCRCGRAAMEKDVKEEGGKKRREGIKGTVWLKTMKEYELKPVLKKPKCNIV